MLHGIVALGLAIAAACAAQTRETFDERRLYHDFLAHFFARANEGARWKGMALQRTTPPKAEFLDKDHEKEWESLRSHLGSLRRDTFDDFRARNQERQELPGRVDAPFRTLWLSDEEIKTLFGKGARKGWRRFYEDHPRLKGILRLSLAGVSADGRQALLYYGHQHQPLAGHGGFVLLTRERGGWKVAAEWTTWIS